MIRKEFPVLNLGQYLGPALLLIPVLVGLLWGTHFHDGVYTTYRFAQNLAAGRGFAQEGGVGLQSAPAAPFFSLLMARHVDGWKRVDEEKTGR